MSRFWHNKPHNGKGANTADCDSDWMGPVAAVGVAIGAAAIAYRLWRHRKQTPKHNDDSDSSSTAAESADAARAALYSMPAYTSLSLSQAQQIFDAFRPPSPSSSSRRFIVESIKELLGGLSNSNYKITVRDTRAAANNAGSKPVLRTYLLKVCEEKNDVELRAQVRALGLIRAISMDNRIPLAHPQFDRPCRISYPYRVGLSAEADSDSEEEEQNASAHASHDASAASKLPGDEYLLHLPSISPRALIFYEYLDGQMLRPSSSSIPAAFREVARAQAQLHSIPLQLPGRSFEFLECVPFGMFAVSKQYATQVIDSPSGAAQWGSHPFIQFLQPYLPVLAAALEVAPSLPQSVIHSDLFLENMIFEADQPATKEVATAPASSSSSAAAAPPRLRGLIDFEEMGVGPRLLDLTMTVVGCCYRSDDSLDLEAASVLVRSYDEFAMLTPQERHNFVAYLEWSLLAIAYWRWQNFNVVHPEANNRKDAYLPMQRRVQELQNANLRASIQRMLEA